MNLPVMPPVKPMLAKATPRIPTAEAMTYEPKWDGFRCIVFRDGDEVELGSRTSKPLTRYFPEVVETVLAQLPDRCVVDGEIVIAGEHGLDFEALLQRVHPAASRVRTLAHDTPASFVAFDLLTLGDESLMDTGFAERRQQLTDALADAAPPVYVTPATNDPDLARQWFEQFEGAGLDGIVAKKAELPYAPDVRSMAKIKHERLADCVVAGFRWHKSSTEDDPRVGSLLLALHDDAGELQHVGVCASFSIQRRRDLLDELAQYRDVDLAEHPWASWAAPTDADPTRMPGAASRWNGGKDLSFEPLRPELVVEVAYDHMQGTRFRHTTQFRRWRPDRDAVDCTYAQLESPVSLDLGAVFG